MESNLAGERDHELSFGGVRCVVRISGSPEVAMLFVVVKDDAALSAIVDARGTPIAIEEQPRRDALGLAMRYLREHLGEQDMIVPVTPSERRQRDVLDAVWKVG